MPGIHPSRQAEQSFEWKKLETPNSTYQMVGGEFLFRGTDVMGEPGTILALCGLSAAGGDMAVRIFDVTNGAVICEKTGVTALWPNAVDMGPLDNLPTSGINFWELQIKRTSGSDKAVGNGLVIEYPE
jgi:hypothetical protein